MATQMHNLVAVLANVSGSTFIGIDTETVETLKGGKSNPMQGRVTKRTIGSRVQVFQNKNSNGYQNMVHRRLATQLRNQAAERASAAQELLAKDLTEEQLIQLAGTIDSFMAEADRLGEAQGLFKLSPRKWGERIPNTPFIKHTKEKQVHADYYLEVIFLKAGTSEYLLDGKPIAADLIEGLNKPEKKVADNVQGGLVDQVIVRSYSVASLTGVRVDKQDFQGRFYYA